ncbi:hypothetical protein ANN_04790 [Periplaneta americana]|uniref:Reverse transcriptase n=1 Tax=Periplaneta americana TaxID=6978 RepID=A0ABQ8T9D8_PERAM|nr:hypothetical protein ANN_04790 [Periplaneta americana]
MVKYSRWNNTLRAVLWPNILQTLEWEAFAVPQRAMRRVSESNSEPSGPGSGRVAWVNEYVDEYKVLSKSVQNEFLERSPEDNPNDQVIISNSEDNLQRGLYTLNKISDFGMEISAQKSRVMAFLGQDPIRTQPIAFRNGQQKRVGETVMRHNHSDGQ